jgi:predicted metalloprotease with PDZ domain
LTDGRLPIEKVASGSPAEAAGLEAGDQILRLNGRAVAEMSRYELSLTLQARPLAIELLRDGRTIDITIDTPEEPRKKASREIPKLPGQNELRDSMNIRSRGLAANKAKNGELLF